VHVGILGGGNISHTHARAAVAAGCKVVAVCGQNAEKTAAIAEGQGAVHYADLDRFLNHRPLDIVAIGSPSGVHAEQISAAASRGLHVLVEKPVDISVSRVDAALADAARAGVRVGVFFQDRLKPDLARVKQLIADGRVGRPILASARVKWYRPPEYYAESKWRGTWALDGGGALMNQGIHTIDLLLWLLGPITSVSARATTGLHEIEVEDTLVATLQFANETLATFETTTAAYPGYPRRVEITGVEGTVTIEGDHLVGADFRSASQHVAGPTSGAATATASQSSPAVTDVTPHRRVFEDFINAIRANREPVCSGHEGRRSVAVVEAIYKSARRGQSVTVPEAR
jgi:predicted dehydrogenase